ncbi:hypothetical protein K2173_022836 [Erythroxylum novogranatense]|uniref:BAT2 N-terminal domain-containing protein n=1 Tax=Erythroxylum novogranatense TaxID=1862640 RepID=A0AAV8SMW9_9ROSI|nr:hypothetical protein K2173_022836 [Erythroxylum novogranatense]
MTSNMLAGERRWASARRGGMTVLGKVAVPKPINLPSQRLENRGLDPNVEIVPKGTHSWGTKSSSSASNAWSSSSLSANTDGGSGSPSHLSCRPSSGESGTRPSTAGSDRNHEPISNAWGSNSRPSSASGTLTSNQTSLSSLRPHSAETRPGSSQLSRFAEPLSDNSVAWGSTGTVHKLGMEPSKNDGFSLISGDFPTLGSEKETSGRNSDSQDYGSHVRPSSSSGGVTAGKERSENSVGDPSINGNVKSGTVASWRKEDPSYSEDGARTATEKWHADPQVYPNSNVPPQHYDAWHGPPVNNHPGGVWYRGPPGGPTFGPSVAPGGFPMDPFPYYHPQMPPAAIANQQPGPPPGAGPRGPRSKNGDMFRPHIHEPYVHPGMPIRPGFYPGPVPYEGYYGPPMGYCSASERDIPFMGMPRGPCAFNIYSGQGAPDHGNPHGRSSGFGPGGKSVVSQQGEPGHPQDAQGTYRVLLKQHDGWEGGDEQRWDDFVTSNASDPGRVEHLRNSSCGNGWRGDNKDEGMLTSRNAFSGEALEAVDNQGGMPLKVKASERVGNMKSSDDRPTRKLENADNSTSTFQGISASPKDPSLIQKIESLNAKARASDGIMEVKSTSSIEESKVVVCDVKSDCYSETSGMYTGFPDRGHPSGVINTASNEDHMTTPDRRLESVAASRTMTTRRSTNGTHNRVDFRGRGRFNAQETDGWWTKSESTDLPGVISSSDSRSACTVQRQGNAIAVGDPEKYGSYLQGKDRESLPPVLYTCDSQRAKMREAAMQRHKQREREEEERIREQKAKALAKLEELNRRTQAGEDIFPKLETLPVSAILDKKENVLASAQPTVVGSKSGESSSAVILSKNADEQGSDSSVAGVENPSSLSKVVLQGGSKIASMEPVLLEQSEPLQCAVVHSDSLFCNTTQVSDSVASKQKHAGYRQKLKVPNENNPTENLVSSSTTETLDHIGLTSIPPVSSEDIGKETSSNSEARLPVNPHVVESSTHNRKKNKSIRNRQRAEEALPTVTSPPVISRDTTALANVTQGGESKISEPLLDSRSLHSQTDSKDVLQSSEQRLPDEESRPQVNNQWKSQHSRRLPRNSQGNKLIEKFHSGDAVVWAPVRLQNKTELSDEVSQKAPVATVISAIKIDQQVQNIPRNKRAEMERYIPKPVAKEMAQQGSSHHSSIPPVSQVTADHNTGRPESGSFGAEGSQISDASVGKVGPPSESRNLEGRQSKSGKVHGSWRQRGVVEPNNSNQSRNAQKPIEHQAQKSDVFSVKEQSRYADEWNVDDGWNIPEEPNTEAVVPVTKQGMTARGKRQLYKGHKTAVHDYGSHEKKISSGDGEKIHVQHSATDFVQNISGSSKEHRPAGASHWQPKSQQSLVTNQRGSRPNSGQDVTEPVNPHKKEFNDREASGAYLVADNESAPEKGNMEEASNVEPQEMKRERKGGMHKRQPGSPAESSSPSNVDIRNEYRPSSGFRKTGNQNSRFGGEQESHGDWNGSGKDNKQYNMNRERQRHYEYQPVGPHNNTKAIEVEPPKDGSYNSGPRFRERGQSHPRRGGARQRVDGGYD